MKIKCVNCNEIIKDDDDVYDYDGGKLCQACFEYDFFMCEGCNEVDTIDSAHKGSDAGYYCQSCFNDRFNECEDCGEPVSRDDTRWVCGDRAVCQSCYDDSYFYCEGCERDLHNDDYGGEGLCRSCYEEREETCDNHRLMGYHEGERLMTKQARKSRFKCGVEVEKEDGDVEIDADAVYVDTKWCIESDASLDGETGYEAVSPILPLDFKYHKFLEKEINKMKYYINANHSARCGGHIHISDTKRKPIEIARDIRGYMPLLYAMYPKRCDRGYSKARQFKDIFRYPAEHCSAFNVGNITCEVRIFPSPKNADALMWRLKLLHLMLLNPRKYADDVVRDIRYKNALYLHLRLVYTDEQIHSKLNTMTTYTEFFKSNLYFK